MTITSTGESAQIYQFPARGRFAVAAHRESETVVNLMSSRAGKIVSGGAWYHEAAIQDSDVGHKI